MTLFRAIKRAGEDNFSDDKFFVFAGFLQSLLGGARLRFLFVIVKENRRPVLAADVRPLAVKRGRIVITPECLKQIVIRNLRRIVVELHDFSMAAAAATNVLRSRIRM